MADKRITDLANKPTAAAADIVPIVDSSSNTTKRTTIAGLAAAIAASFAAAVIKATNLDFTTFVNHYTKITTITNVTAGNFTGTAVNRGSSVVVIPAGCVRALVIGTVNLQSQVGPANDMQSWVQVGSTATPTSTTPIGLVTGVGIFSSGMSAMTGIVTVAPGNNTFNLMCTVNSTAASSRFSAIIIPLPS